MLIVILGNYGSGKTLLLTYLATKTKRNIFSNFGLKIKNYNSLDVLDLLNLPNNIDVFLDEAYTWLESRLSGKAINRYLSYILLQSRKRTLDIYCTAQLFSTIDIRFRHKSDIIIECHKYKDGFHYKFFNKNTFKRKYLILPFSESIKYYKYYDTYEIVEPYEKARLEFSLLLSDTNKLFKRAKEIAKYIKPKLSKITHDSVKFALMDNGFVKDFEPYVYPILKDGVKY